MEEEWGDDAAMSNLLVVEEPSACHLPCSVRFRAFSDPTTSTPTNNNNNNNNNNSGVPGASNNSNNNNSSSSTGVSGAASPNSYCLQKRRRLDDAPGCEHPGVVQPLLRVLRHPIDIARRRQETLRWLEKPRSAEDIHARLALDRRLGVTPSLATVHGALARLKQLHRTEMIADMAEDIVMDSPALSIWTLLKIVEGLKGHPQRAARVVFSLAPLVTNGTVPTSVWSSLCCELDKVARQMPAPLERSLVELFGQVLYRVQDDGPMSGSIVVYYGQALLKSQAPIRSIVGFVQRELLSGRNTPPNDTASELRLGAFLSELIQVMCSPSDEVSEREGGPPFTVRERLLYCGDFVKHAYAAQLRLTQAAFDAFLRFCDEEGDYHRLCIVFLAMCALSTPTLISATRVAEMLCDVEEMSLYLTTLLRQPSAMLMLYVIQRHGKASLFPVNCNTNNNNNNNNNANSSREELELHFCECVAQLCARDGDASLCMNVFTAIIDQGRPTGVHVFICTLLSSLRALQRLSDTRVAASYAVLFEPFNLETLYYALQPPNLLFDGFYNIMQSRPLASLFPSRDVGDKVNRTSGNGVGTSALTVENVLTTLFTSPQVYGTVIDESAIRALADSVPLTAAFVKMMTNYAAKTGAVALVHFDVCTSKELTHTARQLLIEWLTQHRWFVVLPLSLAIQLPASKVSLISANSHQEENQQHRQNQQQQLSCVQLFHEIRRIGHKKVALMTDSQNVADLAKEEGVHPVITLTELRTRLGVS